MFVPSFVWRRAANRVALIRWDLAFTPSKHRLARPSAAAPEGSGGSHQPVQIPDRREQRWHSQTLLRGVRNSTGGTHWNTGNSTQTWNKTNPWKLAAQWGGGIFIPQTWLDTASSNLLQLTLSGGTEWVVRFERYLPTSNAAQFKVFR